MNLAFKINCMAEIQQLNGQGSAGLYSLPAGGKCRNMVPDSKPHTISDAAGI